MQKKEIFVGAGICKSGLDVVIRGTKEHRHITNNSEGVKTLRAWLKSLNIPACAVLPK